jgi:hypothetical protein
VRDRAVNIRGVGYDRILIGAKYVLPFVGVVIVAVGNLFVFTVTFATALVVMTPFVSVAAAVIA